MEEEERTSLQGATSKTLRPAIDCYPETAQHVIRAGAKLVAKHTVQLMQICHSIYSHLERKLWAVRMVF